MKVHKMKEEDKTKEQLINDLVGLRQRITELETLERKKAEKALRETSNYLEKLINYANAPIIVWDTAFKITRFNHAFEHLTGYTANEVIGKELNMLFPEASRDESLNKIERTLRGEHWESVELPILRKDGDTRMALWNSANLYAEDGRTLLAVIAQGQDITERKRAEEALRASEQWLSTTLRSIGDAVIATDIKGLVTLMNHVAGNLTGWDEAEAVGKPLEDVFNIINEQTGELAENPVTRVLREGVVVGLANHTVLIAKDGTKRPIADSGAPMRDDEGNIIGTVMVFRDITEQKKAEKALRETSNYLEKLINYANAPIIVWDPAFKITRFNHAFEHLTGYTANEVIDKELNMLFPEASRDESLNKIERTLRGEHWESVEIPILRKDGDTRIALWNSANLYAEDGRTLLAVIAQGQDITERKRAEKQIKTSLREKEVLLREIHHRVKNNLQVISSMLYLQSGYLKDKKALEMFKETRDRIKSMALIHEELYQSKDLSQIDVVKYLQKLATDLINSYRIKPEDIKLKMDVHEVLLGVNTAVPFGLIISELVSNSLKHAFPNGGKGEISIALRSAGDNKFALIVSDNGVGFPKDLDFRNTETLGLQLVMTLVKQLKGTIELDRSAGTEFKITFTGQKHKNNV